MAHGDSREEKWWGNWRMEWVASTLHTTSENGVSNITTADEHTSAGSSRLNWRPRRFKWTRLFWWKTKSGFCTCAITFQLRQRFGNRFWPFFSSLFSLCEIWGSHSAVFEDAHPLRFYAMSTVKYIVNVDSNDRGSFNCRVKHSLTRLFYIKSLRSFKTSVKNLSVDIKR